MQSHPIHYLDQNSYRGHYNEWLDWLGRLEDLLKHGKEMVAMLYTFRSVSKAIPMVGAPCLTQRLSGEAFIDDRHS